MESLSPNLHGRRKQSTGGASILGANKHTYEGLDYWEPYNDARRQKIKEMKKTRGGNVAMKWCLFAIIGFIVALISVTMKQSVERVVLFRFSTIHSILDPQDESSFDGNGTDHQIQIREPNYVTACIFWVFTSALLAFLSSAVIVFIEPKASGSGLPEVMAYLNGVQLSRTFSLRVMGVKFLSCLLAVSSGLPVGPEGPMIHLGSMVGAFLTQKKHANKGMSSFIDEKLRPYRNTADRIGFMTCGAAAGVSAAFGAPVGGLLFVMEEISSYWDQRLTWTIFFSTMISFYTVVCLNTVMHGWYPTGFSFGELAEDAQVLFQPEILSKVHMNLMIIFPAGIIGLVCGLVGVLFTRLNIKINKFRRKFIKKSRIRQVLEPVVLAILFGTLSFVFPLSSSCDEMPMKSTDTTTAAHEVKGANHNDFAQFVCGGHSNYSPLATLTLNSGENAIRHLYSKGTRGQFQSGALLSFFALYFSFSGYASGAAYASGIVIPMLVMGAITGRLLGEFTHSLVPGFDDYDWFDPGIFALVGSAAMFAGVSRLTVSLAVIMLEISHEVYFLPPMMVAIMISKCLADYMEPHSLYHQIIQLNNVPFLEPLDFLHAPRYELLSAKGVMSSPVLSIMELDTLGNIFVCLGSGHHAFPVVNSKNKLKGVILRSQLESLLVDMPRSDDGNSNARWDDLKKQIQSLQTNELLDIHSDWDQRQTLHSIGTSLSMRDRSYLIDFKPLMNKSPFVVHQDFRLNLTKMFFQTLGVRHLVVVDSNHVAVGIITRKDLLDIDENIKKKSYSPPDSCSRSSSSNSSSSTILVEDEPDLYSYRLATTPLQKCTSSSIPSADETSSKHSPKSVSISHDEVANKTLPQLPYSDSEDLRRSNSEVTDLERGVSVTVTTRELPAEIPNWLLHRQVSISESKPVEMVQPIQRQPEHGSQSSISESTFGTGVRTLSSSIVSSDKGDQRNILSTAPRRKFRKDVEMDTNPLQPNSPTGILPYAVDISRFKNDFQKNEEIIDGGSSSEPTTTISSSDDILGGRTPTRIADETLRQELRDLMSLIGVSRNDSQRLTPGVPLHNSLHESVQQAVSNLNSVPVFDENHQHDCFL